eukprot:3313879-Rhodomonas_salina.1
MGLLAETGTTARTPMIRRGRDDVALTARGIQIPRTANDADRKHSGRKETRHRRDAEHQVQTCQPSLSH